MSTAQLPKIVLNEVFKTNFSIFDSYEETVKKEQIKKLNYIEQIAYQLEKNLTDVNLFDIFENKDGIITADETQINTNLINFNREEYFGKPDPIQEIKKLNADQLKIINTVYLERMKRIKCQKEGEISSFISKALSAQRKCNTHMANASKIRQELKLITLESTEPLVNSINEVLKDTRFSLGNFSGNTERNDSIEFLINDDIICTHKNSRADIDLRVNLGLFAIQVKFDDGINIRVIKKGNNIDCHSRDYGNIYHPHLGNDGEICLGNMSDLFMEAIQDFNLYKLCDITYNILMNYNDGNPFVSLINFAQTSQQIQPNGEKLELISSSNRDQYHNCPECEHEFEIEFPPESQGDFSQENCPDCEYTYDYEYFYE